MLALVATPSPATTTTTPRAGQVGGWVGYPDGDPAGGVAVDLFSAQPAGGRDRYLASTTSGDDGRYRFAVADGCYVVVMVAPEGQGFDRGGRYHQAPTCVAGGRADRAVDGSLRAARAAIEGRVVDGGAGGVGGVVVDLFHGDGNGARFDYVASAVTAGDEGRYVLSVPAAGCYQLVFIAPAGLTFDGGRYRPVDHCAGAGVTSRVDTTIGRAGRPTVSGWVRDQAGHGVEGVPVDVFAASADGRRGPHRASTSTDAAGRYRLDAVPRCSIVVLTAPDHQPFVDHGPSLRQSVCGPEGVPSSVDGIVTGVDHGRPTALTAVELEIVRLTNALRADPDGPLARQRPMPPCVDDPFYDIALDPVTGHPQPAEPLSVDEAVSVEMARAWAAEMERRDLFAHRTSRSQQAIYRWLGLDVGAWGENIAWFSGYGPDRTATAHFEGWRESDTGHYCSLVTSRFDHVGVGEHRVGDQSWAVQNFYIVGG